MNETPNKLASILESLQQETPASEAEKPSPQEFTIDQLAFAAHTTVRNIRAYQDRGLLHPPTRRGRVGIYSEIHLARLRIISQLIERGYSLTTIGDLITAWESGRRLSDVLGLEVAVTTAWRKETPVAISMEQLLTDFQAHITQQDIQRIIGLGYIEIEGTQIRILKPRIYNASKELVAAGIPMTDLIEHVSMVRADIEKLAERFVDMALFHLIDKKYSTDGLPDGEGVATLAKFIKRTPALAEMIVDTEIERLLDMTLNNALLERLEKVLRAQGAVKR
jgi:DNA-binding transcriptional MerR regulator